MPIDIEDDIVQDFLVESREILENLNEQLVDLENSPEDKDLLNAIFRGFHTIKGGAGFLNLDALVDVCHQTEDLFNLLRSGELSVTPPLMDAVLQALDVVVNMFEEIEGADDPTPASPALLATIKSLMDPNAAVPAESAAPATPPPAAEPPAAAAPPPAPAAPAAGEGDISDQEFEALLDVLDDGAAGGAAAPAPAAPAGDSDTISEDEFENLLDELHGAGGSPTAAPAAAAPAAPAAGENGSDLITDDEFERLLDEMHGEGGSPTAPQAPAAAAPTPPPAVAPEPVAEVPAAVEPEPPAAAAPPPPPPPPPKAPAAKKGGDAGKDKGGPKPETTVRVDTSRLDDIMNLVGELVLVRNRLVTIRGTMEDENLNKATADLELVTSDLQTAVMKTRMQPIKKVFGRFPRVVRDLARSLKKQIDLELRGEETDLDKNLVEALADPLVHLVRNAVDHGVESPEVRQANGKDPVGKVILSAEQEGDHILLTIEDDGGGMDAEALRAKVVEKGLMDEESAARLDEHDCYNLIFMPGFSTKTEISDVSGRGVGMDVVKTRISQLNGMIEIDSEIGKGTKLSIKVPLTLAILPTLMVKVRDRKFALPMSVVREIFELQQGSTKTVDGQLVVMVRNKAMPLFYLERWLMQAAGIMTYSQPSSSEAEAEAAALASVDYSDDLDPDLEQDDPQVVTLVLGNQAVGFVVDEVIGLEEVVIKPLGAMLQGLPGLAGSTITGDGRIALIVDIPSLIKGYGGLM